MNLEHVYTDVGGVIYKNNKRYFRIGVGIFGSSLEEYKLGETTNNGTTLEKVSSVEKIKIFKDIKGALVFLENLEENGSL